MMLCQSPLPLKLGCQSREWLYGRMQVSWKSKSNVHSFEISNYRLVNDKNRQMITLETLPDNILLPWSCSNGAQMVKFKFFDDQPEPRNTGNRNNLVRGNPHILYIYHGSSILKE